MSPRDRRNLIIGAVVLGLFVVGLIVQTTQPDDYGFCDEGKQLLGVLGQVQAGTLTNSEIVAELDGLQDKFANDAILFRDDGDTRMARVAQAFADALGRLKVAIDSGADPSAALAVLNTAVSGIPDGYCPV